MHLHWCPAQPLVVLLGASWCFLTAGRLGHDLAGSDVQDHYAELLAGAAWSVPYAFMQSQQQRSEQSVRSVHSTLQTAQWATPQRSPLTRCLLVASAGRWTTRPSWMVRRGVPVGGCLGSCVLSMHGCAGSFALCTTDKVLFGAVQHLACSGCLATAAAAAVSSHQNWLWRALPVRVDAEHGTNCAGRICCTWRQHTKLLSPSLCAAPQSLTIMGPPRLRS